MDGTGSGSYPLAGFIIRGIGIESSGSSIIVQVTLVIRTFAVRVFEYPRFYSAL